MKKVLLTIASLAVVPSALMADMDSSLVLGQENAARCHTAVQHFKFDAKADLTDMRASLTRSPSSEDLTEEQSRQVAAAASASQESTGFFSGVSRRLWGVYAFVKSFF